MMSRISCLLFSFVFVFVSCHKKDAVPPENANGNRLARVDRDSINQFSFTYQQQTLTKFSYRDHGVVQNVSIGYNAQGRPGIVNLGRYRLGFIYTGGQLTRVNIYDTVSAPQLIDSYTDFSYAGGKIVQSLMYVNMGNSYLAAYRSHYQYTGAGDLQSVSNYLLTAPNVFMLTDSSSYQYNSQFHSLPIPKEIQYVLYMNPSSHNLSKEMQYDGDGQWLQTSVFSYEYDAAGRPLKVKETLEQPGQTTGIHQWRYYY